jgi:hypothetical protein
VHQVSSIDKGLVKDTEGNYYLTRHVLPVPAGSAATTHTENMRGGSARVDKKHREALAPFKERVVTFVGAGKSLRQAAAYMRSIGMEAVLKATTLNYKKALSIFGLNVEGLYVFPAGVGMASEPAAAVAAAPPAPPAPPAPIPAPIAAAAALRRRINVKGPSAAYPSIPSASA